MFTKVMHNCTQILWITYVHVAIYDCIISLRKYSQHILKLVAHYYNKKPRNRVVDNEFLGTYFV